jgi:hypothetical protein
MKGGSESDSVCSKCGMRVGFNFDNAFNYIKPNLSKAQAAIIKQIDTTWMTNHVTYWNDEKLLLGKGSSGTYKLLNPKDIDKESLDELSYSNGEVSFDDAEFTHVCCDEENKKTIPWINKLKSISKDDDIFDGQYFFDSCFIMKVLGHEEWDEMINVSDIPDDAFEDIHIDKFEKLKDLLNFPKSSPQHQKVSTLTYNDSTHLSKEFLNKLKKDNIKILSTLIKIEVKGATPTKAVAKAPTKAPTKAVAKAPTKAIAKAVVGPKVVLFSGFRDASLEEQAKINGWDVKSSFTKTVTLLVVKDLSKETEKTIKARDAGIRIMTKEEFIKLL